MPRRLWNSPAERTASWPIIASATNGDFGRIQFALQLAEFLHQVVVDVEAAGGVHQDHVAGGQLGFAKSAANDFERFVGSGSGPHGCAGGFRYLRQLFAGGGTVHVG